MAYSTESDLLLGNIPLPSYLDVAKYIQDADDEIDSQIGYIYETPLDVTDDGPLVRPARLLIKRLSKYLATGRIILAVASPEENKNLHAYGWSLIQEVQTTLAALASGQLELQGAYPLNEPVVEKGIKVPFISNLDSESSVEAFYDRIANPNYTYTPELPWADPDRFIG